MQCGPTPASSPSLPIPASTCPTQKALCHCDHGMHMWGFKSLAGIACATAAAGCKLCHLTCARTWAPWLTARAPPPTRSSGRSRTGHARCACLCPGRGVGVDVQSEPHIQHSGSFDQWTERVSRPVFPATERVGAGADADGDSGHSHCVACNWRDHLNRQSHALSQGATSMMQPCPNVCAENAPITRWCEGSETVHTWARVLTRAGRVERQACPRVRTHANAS